jgi:hypothetical protein
MSAWPSFVYASHCAPLPGSTTFFRRLRISHIFIGGGGPTGHVISFGRTAPEMVMSANSRCVLTRLPIDYAASPNPEPHFPARFPEAG